MTDKQIIIDGVDVSGCIVFNNKWGTPLCNPTEDIREAVHCSDNPNCLYKKYKRKEQECEKLKHDNGYEVGALEKTIDNLKAENKELKKVSCKFKDYCTCDTEKLKKTLTEIKELLLKTPTDSPMHCVNAKSVILQKISECEVEK